MLPFLAVALAQLSTLEPVSSSLLEARDATFVDLGRDGDQDLLVIDEAIGGLLVRESLGGATLDPLRRLGPFSEFDAIGGIEADDFDGDGFEEVIMTCVVQGNPAVVVLSTRTSSTLVPEHVFRSPLAAPLGREIQVVDYDGDGDRDYLFPEGGLDSFSNGGVQIALRTGALALTFSDPLAGGTTLLPVVYFDMDQDGRLDLVHQPDSASLVWRQQSPSGALGAPSLIDPNPPQRPALDLDVADFDGNGVPDLVICQDTSNSIFFYVGGASLGSWSRSRIGAQALDREHSMPFDVDGDGDKDLLIFPVLGRASTLRWLEYRGGLDFTPPRSLVASHLGLRADWLDAVELNGDGLTDLVAGASSQLSVVPGASAGGLDVGAPLIEYAPDTLTLHAGQSIAQHVARDVDLDGDMDVLTGPFFIMNRGGGRFDAPLNLDALAPFLDLREVADISGDGLPDLIGIRQFSNVAWLEADGAGGYTPHEVPYASPLYGIAALDIDLDGDQDLVAASFDGMVLFETIAPGVLSSGRTVGSLAAFVRSFELADVDGDGITDCVAGVEVQFAPDVLLYMPGDGQGDFGLPVVVNYLPAGGFTDLHVSDLGGSGVPDIAWLEGSLRALRVVRGLGGGAFSDPVTLGTTEVGSNPLSVVSAPAPGSSAGRDLFVATAFGGTGARSKVYRLAWQGGVSFSPPSPLDFELEGRAVLNVADLDVDGDQDLIVGAHGLHWLRDTRTATFGTSECGPLVPNSTGRVAHLVGVGSDVVSLNNVRVVARDLPSSTLGLLLVSRAAGYTPMPGGSSGVLCLSGSIGRFMARPISGDGRLEVDVDLADLPQPLGSVAVQPGETWRFQTWSRDSVAGVATSNFSESLAVTFR